MTISDLASHLETTARVLTVTAQFLTDLTKELER